MVLPGSKENTWRTHRWMTRQIEIDGRNLFLLSCAQCGRDFIEDLCSKERYAVHLSIFRTERLIDRVTEQWCRETCPGKRLKPDDADRLKILPESALMRRIRRIAIDPRAVELPPLATQSQ